MRIHTVQMRNEEILMHIICLLIAFGICFLLCINYQDRARESEYDKDSYVLLRFMVAQLAQHTFAHEIYSKEANCVFNF